MAQQTGQSLTEVLIASSALAITIIAVSRGMINAQGMTHLTSQRNAAQALMTNDLETTMRQRFFSFRCSQGPCLPASTDQRVLIQNQDKPLRYYNDENKQDFIKSCQKRQLAKDLLAANIDGITTGQATLTSSSHLLNGITIERSIELDKDNQNRVFVKYEARRNNKQIAYHKAILIPNAVHWCG